MIYHTQRCIVVAMITQYVEPNNDQTNSSADPLLAAAGKTHILVIDDDERLRELLSRFLTESGFLVTTAESAAQARDILNELSYDLIVCDVMMPGEDGLSLTRSLKDSQQSAPILLLTALGEVDARITGLEAGADDYLAKPFEPRELLLRINAIMRRVTPSSAQSKTVAHDNTMIGKWRLDLQRGELIDTTTDNQERVALTQVEHTLLKALLSRHGVTVSREELAELCGVDAAERTIDVQVTRLRKKIESDPKMPKYVQTVRGKGYVLWLE